MDTKWIHEWADIARAALRTSTVNQLKPVITDFLTHGLDNQASNTNLNFFTEKILTSVEFDLYG